MRQTGVKTFLDGNLVSRFKADSSDLALAARFALKNPTILGLGTYRSVFVFHRVEVVERSGPGTFTRLRAPVGKLGAPCVPAFGRLDANGRARPGRGPVIGPGALRDAAALLL